MGGNGDGKIIFASFFSALFDNVDKIEIRVYDICPNVTTTAKKNAINNNNNNSWNQNVRPKINYCAGIFGNYFTLQIY